MQHRGASQQGLALCGGVQDRRAEPVGLYVAHEHRACWGTGNSCRDLRQTCRSDGRYACCRPAQRCSVWQVDSLHNRRMSALGVVHVWEVRS